MKPPTLILTLIGLCLLTRMLVAADGLEARFPFLASLNLSPETLPDGCAVKRVRGDLENRFVTMNSDYFLIGDERLSKLVDKKSIEAAYIGLYREKSDAWVIGWSFSSDAAAKEAYAKLEEGFKNERERFQFWRAEKYVVWLGREPDVTDQCFERLQVLVKARVAAAKP